MNFTADKLKQARDAGYSDDEIWGFVSEQDDRFSKAKDAGYSLEEVSGFFSEQQAPQEPVAPVEPAPPVGTSFFEEVAAIPQAIRQAVDQPLEAMGETAEVLGAPSVGGALRGAVDAAEGYVPAAQRFMEPQEGEFQIGGFAPQFLPRAIVEQAGQIAGAIATRAAGMAVGGLAGSALGPKGTVAGSVAGAFLGPALFEMSQIVGPVARERAANQGREEPTTDDLAWAWGTAGASGALNAIGAKYLPNGDKLVGGLASRIATAVAGEGTTEGLQSVVQQTGQTFLTEQGLEIKPKEAIGEALIGGGAGGAAVVAAAPFTPTPEAKATAAADTKIAAEQAAPVAPETAQAVSEQANQVINEAQAEETAETPEQRVARLQEEATAAAGIELEEEPTVSGFPPERIKSARWFESASRNRLRELQDKDEAGVEDFTTQETEEYTFLQSNPTPEQIAERYGYQVRTDVEPTTVTPTEPAAAPTPAESLLTRKSELDAEAKRLGADNISSFNSMYATRENLTEEQRNLLNQYGEYNKQVVELGWRDAAKLDDADFGRWEKIKLTTKPVSDQELTDLGKLYLAFNERGETQKAESVLKSIQSGKRKTNNTIEGWFKATDETLTQEEIDTINRENQDWNDSVDAMTEILGRKTPPEEISPTDIAPTLTPTPAVTPPAKVAPEVTPETPNLEPLRRVARAEQAPEDVPSLVDAGFVEVYKDQPVLTEAGIAQLPEAERPRLTPEARKIQIDTGSNEVVAEAIAKGLRIGVDQVGPNVTLPAGWTLVEDIYVPPSAPEVRESRREQPVVLKNRFYSQLERVVAAKMPNVSSPEQLKAIIDPTRGSGVKPEEIKWSGITEAIDRIASENNGRVPKEAIIKYMQDEGRVRFEEVRFENEGVGVTVDTTDWKVGDPIETKNGREWVIRGKISEDSDLYEWKMLADTKNEAIEIAKSEAEELLKNLQIRSRGGRPTFYDRWQLEGGENYREVVLTVSNDKYINPKHFEDIKGYVAHMRLNDRKDSDGKEGTFIEEIQSDRHQAGREKGYREDQIGKLPKNWSVKQRGESWIVVDEYGEQIGPLQSTEEAAIQEGISQANFNDINVPSLESGGIADAPFRKDWPLQMFKRALEEAVASGKEWIGWTVGETQADRYDLSKQIGRVILLDTANGNQFLYAYGLGGNEVLRQNVRGENIANIIGKDAAEKLLNAKKEKQPNGATERSIEGMDLKVGGEGMSGFYDNILPKEIAKYVKKWGGRVEKSRIDSGYLDTEGGETMASRPKSIGRSNMGWSIILEDGTYWGAWSREDDAQRGLKLWQDRFDGRSGTPIWRVNITPEMRRIIEEEGQSLFSLQMPSRGAGMETEAVATKLESLGFGRGGIVSVVNEPDASFEGRTIIRDGKVVAIELNAAALKDDAAVERVLNHEIAESANADGALNRLVAGLTPKERKEINDAITRLGYAERARTAEEAARAVELLAEGWRGRKWFDRAVARIEAWANKLGYKLTRRAAEYIAARNMAEVNDSFRKMSTADALANLRGARKVNFNGLRAVLIPPSEMEFAYSIAAYHGTPHVIKGGFQLAKIGTGEGAQAYGWGLYFAENIDVAREYQAKLSRNRFKEEATKVYNDWKANNPQEASIFEDEVVAQGIQNVSNEDFAIELQNILDGFGSTEANVSAAEKLSSRISGIGNLYSVDLNIENDKLLDWDSVFAKQSDFIKNALQPIIEQITDANLGELDRFTFGAVLSDFYRNPKLIRMGSKKEVSDFFAQQGIQGIKYFDRASRFAQPKKTGFGWLVDDYRGSNYFKTQEEALEFAKKAATSNFVVFDESLINVTGLNGQSVDIRESRREDAIPTFSEGSPEASTLSTMAASMAKVDAASEAKPNPENKPTYKISEIASVWMDQGGDTRQLQDMVVEYTNLTPANAKKVANAIAKQYDKQQQIAEAVLETEAGVTLEGLPEGMEIPKDVDPKNKRTVLQRVIDATTGVRVKPVILQVPEKTALKEQIRLKARETREAKKAQKETADAVVEAIKALELRGPMRAKQAQALAKRAAKVIWTSEKSMENFIAYAERVMANTNYDADLREAKAAQKRAKELSKRDSIAAPQRFVLEAIGNVGINLLNDPREFSDVVNHYLRSFKPVVSEAYVVVPDAEMESYLSAAEDEVVSAKAEFDVEDNEKLAEKYGVSVNDLQRFLDAEDIMDALESYAKREVIEGILNEKSSGVKEALKGVDTTILRADQRKLIDSMKVIDVKSLDSAEKQAYIRIGNNIIFNNNQTNGAEFFVATAKGQQAARDLAKNTGAMTKNRAWANILPSLGSRKAKKLLKSWASELQSIADTFRNAFGKEAMTVFYEAMGMVDLDLGFTQAARTLEEIQEKMAKFYNKLDKKYKGAARSQDGILSEGIVAYLIQSVPAKGEADSLAQRRGLMQQNIVELRKSGDEDKIQMADRIQQLIQKLDGDTVDQMLSNLKREYPANYESLMWLKDDLFPQYKDFLKVSDENFNDQANNYNTPNYLPIIYSNASPALDLLQGKKKYYDNLSSSPKQSSYTIKRSDYTQLPMGSDGRTPKEIGLNLRKNAYNSLSDQITRAYTNPARQRIYSFLKTPQAEEALGGKANLDFFADRIERLMGSRERRGSFNEGFFGKAVDVIANLGRDIGTRIALAGSYQLIRQPADQVTVAVGATGRADLMAEHLAPRSIKNARPVLDLFSIGRRGDASSGYKYINQMEGAQSRLERYYTEGNWVKAKEAATRFADKFMTPLKVSDFTVAAATWMTFYRAYLAKNGIRFTTWEDAANLIKSDDTGHKRAAAYAENMTDIYQGSSDPTKMAVFAQKGKTGSENLLKAILVPFNSFGVQFRARVSSDLTEIFTKSGDWKGKAIAVKDLSATIGGTVMFGLAKRFVLPAITYGGVKILYSIFGVDVEEPDEEKKKEEFEQKWRQLQGDIISTMAVGGFGQMVESYTIDGMNYIKYMIDTANESESVLDDDGDIMSFNEYAKERAPFYRYRSFDNAFSLGILDIGMDQAKKSILNTKMVLTPEEMERFTPEEQRFLYVALISDWLYLGGFNDADFARMWDKGRRDMIKARKEEEKEIKAIRNGR